MQRQNISSGAKWEEIVGYSRLVRVGDMIWVSGTVAADDNGDIVGKDDAYAQTRFIIQKIEKCLVKAGSSLQDVVRTRMFVTDISKWEEIGRAHGEFFKEVKPVTTMVEVKALIGEDYLVEIEVEAVMNS